MVFPGLFLADPGPGMYFFLDLPVSGKRTFVCAEMSRAHCRQCASGKQVRWEEARCRAWW